MNLPSRPTARSGRSPLAAMLCTALLAVSVGAAADDVLQSGFQDPPSTSRPRVWWHWMDGNISEHGIDEDLAWMKRIGIGGLQNFDIAMNSPQVVTQPLRYMSPGWKHAFRHAAAEADHLGLEMGIASSPGFSETGGPWVQPKDAMKKLVWSQMQLPGGHRFHSALPPPPSVTGPFQDVPAPPSIADMLSGRDKQPKPALYEDVAVLAYPIDAKAMPVPDKVLSDDGTELDAQALTDGRLDTSLSVSRGTNEASGFVLFHYAKPQTIRSATLFLPGAVSVFGATDLLPRLEAKNAMGWQKLADLPLARVPTTISFAPVTAQEFRVVLSVDPAPPKTSSTDGGAPGAITINLTSRSPKMVKIAQMTLSADARVDRFEAKAGFSIEPDYYALTRGDADTAGIAPGKVIDLTSRLQADGTLDWTPPRGHWRVLRLGYSLVGTTNHPAPSEATGLEVDKYDSAAVRRYLDTYLDGYRDAAPGLIGQHGVNALVTDSTEIDASNWTPDLIAKFRKLRGYDPTPWLPTLTGALIGTRAQSNAFLYDFRRTLGELMASEHYGTVAAVAHDHDLRMYGESLEGGRTVLGDDLDMRAYADVPMAAMWTYGNGGPRPLYLGDMRGAASVAHVYGKRAVAAESLTSFAYPWAQAPADLKKFIDLEFANGVNLPVIHTSVHQPVDDKLPGLSMMMVGQYFTRLETWAEMARPWIDYIARTGYLLQQGRNVADVAYFYGEEAPLGALFDQGRISGTPSSNAYDFISARMLLDQLSVADGDLVSAGGARYRLLYLGGSSRFMTLPVLRRIAEFAEAGATIVGNAPERSPSLADDPQAFDALRQRLWADGDETKVGKGRVIAGTDVDAALAAIDCQADFQYGGASPNSRVLFVHRQLDDGDLYFINNRQDRAEHIAARFRVHGKQPEIWHADSGKIEPVSYRIDGGQTIVPLDLLPQDAFFVVFRKPAPAASADIAVPALMVAATVNGPWTVNFQANRGAPAAAKLATLQSLSESSDDGIRYFSGIATYSTTFSLPRDIQPGAALLLDLGRVGDLADVVINGKPAGIVWKPPYRADVGGLVHRGRNTLEVRVADLWANRLIGDAQKGARKLTFTSVPTYRADAPLRPSGLIGPVTLMQPEVVR